MQTRNGLLEFRQFEMDSYLRKFYLLILFNVSSRFPPEAFIICQQGSQQLATIAVILDVIIIIIIIMNVVTIIIIIVYRTMTCFCNEFVEIRGGGFACFCLTVKMLWTWNAAGYHNQFSPENSQFCC